MTVDYATADGTAVSTGSPVDYTPRNGTLSFSPGVTTLTVSVALTTDSIDELDETLFLNLTLPAGSPATLADAQGTGTIADDDGPTIAVNDITVTEGDAGTSNATFTISLTAAAAAGKHERAARERQGRDRQRHRPRRPRRLHGDRGHARDDRHDPGGADERHASACRSTATRSTRPTSASA